MKRVVVLVALTAALGGAPATGPLAHPLLWSAEKDGRTTYLFGTMHTGVDAATRLPPIVWAKLDAARAFAMETDLDDPTAADAMRPTAGSLRDALGDAYWRKLETALGADAA